VSHVERRSGKGPWHDAFCSYSSKDERVVEKVVGDLRKRGHAIWFDADIPETSRFDEEIKRAIRAADAFLVFLSPDFAASDYCALETGYAADRMKRFIVVQIRPCDLEPLHPAIRYSQFIDLSDASYAEALGMISFWLDQTPEDERERTELVEAARAWKAESGPLRRGGELRGAIGWLRRAEEFLGATRAEAEASNETRSAWEREKLVLLTESVASVRDYLRASRRAALLRRCGAGAAAAAMILLGVYGWNQVRTRISERVAQEAVDRLDDHPGAALSLARAATRSTWLVRPSEEARSTLRRVLSSSLIQVLDSGEPARSAVFDASGEFVAAAHGNRVTLWSWSRGVPVQDLEATGTVNDVSFSAQGGGLVLSSADSTAYVWTGKPGHLRAVAELVHPAGVLRAVFVGGDRVLTVGADRKARLWRIDPSVSQARRSEVPERVFPHDDFEVLVANLEKDDVVTVGGSLAMLWRGPGWMNVEKVRLTDEADSFVDARTSGEWLVAATSSGSVIVRDLLQGKDIVRPTVRRKSGPIEATAAYPGRRLVAFERAGDIHLAGIGDDGDLQELALLKGRGPGVKSIDFSPDGSRLVSASSDGKVRVWRITGEDFRGAGAGVLKLDLDRDASAVAFDPSGRYVAGGDGVGGVQVVELETGRLIVQASEGSGGIAALAFDPAGERLLVANAEGFSKLIDPVKGTVLVPDLEHSQGNECLLESAAFSADGRHVLSLRGPSVMVAELRAAPAGAERRVIEEENEVVAAAVSRTGELLVATRCGVSRRTSDGAQLHFESVGTPIAGRCGCGKCCDDGIVAAAIDPDRGRVLFATSSEVRLWDASGREAPRALSVLDADAEFVRVALGPDGRRAAVADREAVAVWDLSTDEPKLENILLADRVDRIAFSDDSALVATASESGEVLVWSAERGDLTTRLVTTGSRIQGLAFATGARFLAVAGDDGKLRVYREDLFAPWPEIERVAEERDWYPLDEKDRRDACLDPWNGRCLAFAMFGRDSR
jgi:WD40 repeat protein